MRLVRNTKYYTISKSPVYRAHDLNFFCMKHTKFNFIVVGSTVLLSD
jgi:hypothetical protein